MNIKIKVSYTYLTDAVIKHTQYIVIKFLVVWDIVNGETASKL